jgi:phenylacetate-coenzyme A ligase PaaK-like adenylate-forming protein
VLTLDERPCGCGSLFRVIAHIEGRRDDVCYFEANGGGVRPFYPDTIRRMILLASPAIADYQAVQERTGHLRVHVCVLGGARFDDVSRAVRASIERAVAGYDCRLGGLLVEPGGIPEGPGKRRRVRCLLSFPDAGEPR